MLRLLAGMLFLGCMTSVGCLMSASARVERPSETMSLILAHHQSGDHDLDPRGLRDDPGMHYPAEVELREYEIFDLPYPKGSADYFLYRIFLHSKTGRYWLHIGGGIAGVSRFVGPGTVADLRR
jgi:hypothetical protein